MMTLTKLLLMIFVACTRTAAYRVCNSACKFPFIFEGVTYNQCTSQGSDSAWCATETDDQNNYIYLWIACDESCIESPKRPQCRADDQGPFPCADGRSFACNCDGITECSNGSDERSCPFDYDETTDGESIWSVISTTTETEGTPTPTLSTIATGYLLNTTGPIDIGEWGLPEYCAEGFFANAFQIKVDNRIRNHEDDTGMNAVRLFCNNGENITSLQGPDGIYKDTKACDNGFLNAFRVRVLVNPTYPDQLGATFLEMRCNGSNMRLKSGSDIGYGKMEQWKTCPEGWAISVIQTRIHTNRSITYYQDELGLTDVRFWCTPINKEHQTTTEQPPTITSTTTIPGQYQMDKCSMFSHENREKREFYSPMYPNLYPNNTNCILKLTAQYGYVIRLDFRDYFALEPSESCQHDSLEVRDGGFGYSPLKGIFCGNQFPPMITSSKQDLWLRFKSDENIEYRGFRAVYSFIMDPEHQTTTQRPANITSTTTTAEHQTTTQRPANITSTTTTAGHCYPECRNGGVCRRNGHCLCPFGFQGPRCEVQRCTIPNQVIPNSSIAGTVSLMSIKCHNGFTMHGGDTVMHVHCQMGKWMMSDRKTPFTHYMAHCQPVCQSGCQNGGTCVAPEKCQCPVGVTGDACQYT